MGRAGARSLGGALVLLGALGCGTAAPTPTLDAVTPARLCGGEAATLSLGGSGFAPRLGGLLTAPVVDSPTVRATQVAALDGSPSAGAPIDLPARWRSDSLIEVALEPGALGPGLFDLTVTNPGGQTGTRARAFTQDLPPAVVLDLMAPEPARVCLAGRAQTVTVSGTGLAIAGGTQPVVTLESGAKTLLTPAFTLDGCSAMGAPDGAQLCTSLSFTLAAGAVAPGKLTLVVTDPSLGGGGCAGTGARQELAFTVAAAPKLASVTPGTLCMGGGALVLSGSGFIKGDTVTLSDATTGKTLDATKVTVNSSTQLEALFGATPFAANTKLAVTVADPDGCAVSNANAVRIKTGTGGCP